MTSKEITVNIEVGLCAKPASHFIRTANEFSSRIKVVSGDGTSTANAKSLLSVLALGIVKGDTITLIAEGDDEQTAINKLADQIENGFYL